MNREQIIAEINDRITRYRKELELYEMPYDSVGTELIVALGELNSLLEAIK
jgi:hypothetical protein